MIPNMKFYVISIVAIFAALGIGIYIGFTLDTNDFLTGQKEDIVAKLEERFDFLKDENNEIKKELKIKDMKNDEYEFFIDSTYEEIIRDRLRGYKIAIIETQEDYDYTDIVPVLEVAGANVVSKITIGSNILDEEGLDMIYNSLQTPISANEVIPNTINKLIEFLIVGNNEDIVEKLVENDYIYLTGDGNHSIDYIVVAGGSLKENKNRLDLIDKTIVHIANDFDIGTVGIEKTDVKHSDMRIYKGFQTNTIDNIDEAIGKVAFILAIEGRPGHYGIKPTADNLLPNLQGSLPKKIEVR